MFTGLVKDVGRLRAIEDSHYTIKTSLSQQDLPLGASIACNGVCLTVIASDRDTFSVQLSEETLKTTNLHRWQQGCRINLEPALRLSDFLGGHMVTGHIDSVAELVDISGEMGSCDMVFDLPKKFLRFIAPKGSITVEGVSLTVNDVTEQAFDVTIITHTWENTHFSDLKHGDLVNIEVDILARYLDRLLEGRDA